MAGKTFAHCQNLGKPGEDGRGVVHKARGAFLDRNVAVKILPPDKAGSVSNRLGIVAVQGPLPRHGCEFRGMECIADTALIAEIAPRRLCLAEILRLAGQVAEPFPVLGYNINHFFPALTDQPGGFGCTADTMVAAVALTALPSFLRVAK
jgi:hypothetical protein